MLDYDEVKSFGTSAFFEHNPAMGRRVAGGPPKDTEKTTPAEEFMAWVWNDGPKEMNIYMDRSSRFFNTINMLREFRVANTTPWEVFQSVARMYPGYIAAVVPYDNRVTMFFGKPNQPYYWTSGEGVPYYKEAYEEWDENRNIHTYKKITKITGDGRIISEGDAIIHEATLEGAIVEAGGHLATLGVNPTATAPVARIVANVTGHTARAVRGKGTTIAGNTKPTTFLVSKESEEAWNKLVKNEELDNEDQKKIENSLKNDFTSEERDKVGSNVLDLATSIIRSEPENFNKIFNVKNVRFAFIFTPIPRGFTISMRDPKRENLYIDQRDNIVTESQKQDNIGLSPRQRPFRKYHYKDDIHHIVANNIRLDLDSFHNEVVVEYPKNIWKGARSAQDEMARVDSGFQTLAVDKDILPEFKRTIVVRENNIETAAQAKSCALSHLKHEVSKLYQGELVILGDPTIKPHDIVFVYDNYTDMYGPVEVREVVHTMTEDTGFVTTIIPDMCVNVNEPTGIPDILYNAGVFASIVVMGVAITAALPGSVFATGAIMTKIAAGLTSAHIFKNIGKDFFPLFWGMFGTTNVNTREPIKICPLVYDGKPYIAGIEGKDKRDWNLFTLDGFKAGWKETREGISVVSVKVRSMINSFKNPFSGGEYK